MNSTYKLIEFDSVARELLLEGVNILSNAVKVTMGPRGRNVIIENPGDYPVLTKDGVTVARAINLRNQFLNLGAQMVKQAASRTSDVAGDGTTTATVLSQAIFLEGVKMIAAGYPAADIRKGINFATEKAIKNLKLLAIPVTEDEEVKQVGTISANGEEEIGELLLEALNAVGRDGVITVEEAKGFNTSLDIIEGMQLERGYLSPYFVTNQERMTCDLEKPLILMCSKKLDNLKEVMPILEKVLNTQRSLLIISDDVDGDAMQGLVVNKMRGALRVCAIRSPGFGENRINMMKDVAVLTGCKKIISDASGETLSDIGIEDLGTCKKAIIGKMGTLIMGGAGSSENIANRIKEIKEQLENDLLEEDESGYLKMRLAKLAGGVAVLRVGGSTEAEMGERKDRVEDALNATQAAIEEGIVPGGGVALVRSVKDLKPPKDHKDDGFGAGVDIIKKACLSPLRQIVRNSGGTPDVVLEKIRNGGEEYGYNAQEDCYGDMFKMGIIDPLKVVRSALENAASSASMLLTIGCAMIEERESESLDSGLFNKSRGRKEYLNIDDPYS